MRSRRLRIPAPDFSDRPGNQCLQDLDVKIRQALEVQTGLAHLVLPELGQELALHSVLRNEVDDQFPAADREAGKRRVA